MRIIPPAGLDADAIVPQCLDNQYISDAVLDRMLARKKDFKSPCIAKARLEETHAEFVRSLLYASTVVVNRAYLVNSDYLVKQLLQRHSSIPALIRNRAIIPFLAKEKALSECTGFSQNEKALERFRQLEQDGALEDAECLRLSSDDSENTRRIQSLGAGFRRFSKDLDSVANDSESLPSLASQLYSPLIAADRSLPQLSSEDMHRFEDHLRAVCLYAQQHSGDLEREKQEFGRQHIYERFFVEEGEAKRDNVTEGKFSEEMKTPSLRMIKKLIDLKYNANLPDMLNRYTLTPANLPGRSALPFESTMHASSKDSDVKRLLQFRSSVMDKKPALLPRLRKLDLHQVLEIRKLDEWQNFKECQSALLSTDTDHVLQSFERYQKSLLKFQGRLGRWAIDHAPEAMEREDRYNTAFDLTVQAGLITLFVALGPREKTAEIGLGGIAGAAFFELAKDKMLESLRECGVVERFRGMTVKLLVRAQSAVTSRWDTDHTFQLELMRKDEEVHRKDLLDMLLDIQKRTQLKGAFGLQTAEQGSR